MNVNKVDNSSFGMAWNKVAKPYLIEAITTLSSSRQSKAVEIVNALEKNSPFHELSINSPLGYFYAEPLRPEAGSLRTDFIQGERKIGFFSALNDLYKFVKAENAALPQRQQVFSTLTEVLGGFAERGILEPGVRMFDDSMPKVLAGWSAQMAEKGKSVGSVVKQIKRIDDFARTNELKVYIKNDGIVVNTKTLENVFAITGKKPGLKHLDKTEKAIKAYVDMKEAKEALQYAFDEFRTKVADKKVSTQLAAEELARKLRATKPYRYFVSVKQRIAEKMRVREVQRQQDLQASAKKIAEEMKI